MRFVIYLVSLTLIGLCSTRAMGQTVEPGQKDGTAKESKIWEGSFADGTPLTQKRMEELLTAHRAWRLTGLKKLGGECGKQHVMDCMSKLFASDWEADQGRLVLKGANLEDANLKGANLEGANLKGANLRAANLEGANLQDANLEQGDANLERTALSHANLEGANLSGANLKKGADLGGANLTGANLTRANLQGANLSGANLKGARLGMNLEWAKLQGKLGVLLGELPEEAVLDMGAALLERRFGPSGRLFEEVACHP